MTQYTPKFQEEYSAKLTALRLFLSPESALAALGGRVDEWGKVGHAHGQ